MPNSAIAPDLYFLQMLKQLQAQVQQLMQRQPLQSDNLGYPRVRTGPLIEDPDYNATDDLNPDGSVVGPNIWGWAIFDRNNYTTAPGSPGPSPYIAKGTEDGIFGPMFDAGGLVFHVDAYGAVGDGVTDDTDAVVACMTAAITQAGTGATIAFGPKTYLVSQFTIATPGLTVLLAAGCKLLCGTTFTGAGTWIDITAPNVTFCGLGTLDGNWANQDGNEVASICFEAGADSGRVMGLTILDTGHGVLCHADNPRVTDCVFSTCYFSPVDILYTTESIVGGLVRGNWIQMPDPNSDAWTRPDTATFTGINVQNNTFEGPTGVTASADGSDSTATITGYTLTGDEVGWWIEIVGAGGSSANQVPLPNLTGTISSVDVASNSVEIDGIDSIAYAVTDVPCRLFAQGTDGIIIAENRIDYTSTNGTANGIGIQLFVATNCIVADNKITALPGDIGGDKGSGQLISIAGGIGHLVKGNVLLANGTSTACEIDSSDTVYAGNTINCVGNAAPFHCTSKNGLVQDVIIEGNSLAQTYWGDQGESGYLIAFDFSDSALSVGATNIVVRGNSLRVNPAFDVLTSSAAVQVVAPGFLIEGNTFYCNGARAIECDAIGSLQGRVVNNLFIGADSIFHYINDGDAVSDLLIKDNQIDASCETFSGSNNLPVDSNLQAAVALNDDPSVANVVYKDNYQSGVGRQIPDELSFSTSPHTYTNTNLYPELIVINGQEGSGGSNVTNGLSVTLNGNNVIGRSPQSFETDAMGPLTLYLFPGDVVVMDWSGGTNPNVFVIPLQ